MYIINPLFTLVSFVKLFYYMLLNKEFKDENDAFIYKIPSTCLLNNLLLVVPNFIFLCLNIIILICAIPTFITLMIMSNLIILGIKINECCCIPPSEKPIVETTAEYSQEIKVVIIPND
jgi:hypothetical protein